MKENTYDDSQLSSQTGSGDFKPNPEARLRGASSAGFTHRPALSQNQRTDTMSTYYNMDYDAETPGYAGGDGPGSNSSFGENDSNWSNVTSNDELHVEDEHRHLVNGERRLSDANQKCRRSYLQEDMGRVVSLVPETHNRCCKNRYWCISDVCGIVCVVFTWLLVFYAEFVVVKVILWPEISSFYCAFNFLIFQSLTILAICSHTRTMLTDPGAVPRGNATKENIQRMGYKEGQVIFKCPKCCSIKPDRAHHCSVCQRCIRKMDHHCPWVNNCVGENNQKYFVLFTLYIAVMSYHALFMAINHFVSCLSSEWNTCPTFSPPATIILLLFLMFEGLLFALFTSIMFGTQVSAIWHDQTGIEQLKQEEARWVRKSRWKSIQGVFGRFSIHWFSPFAQVPPPSKSHGYLFSV